MSRLAMGIALAMAAGPALAGVVVSGAVIRPAGKGAPATAAYLTLRNTGSRPVALTGASCLCAASVMAHESTMDGGVMRMRAAPRVVIPSHGSVEFKPGGLHLMVTGLKQPLKAGGHAQFRLSFDGAAGQTVRFTAKR